MSEYLIPLGVIVLLMIGCNSNVSMLISHWLNNLLGLPHPGPEDVQGSCWCRRHEGPHKYTFQGYLKSLL